MAYLIVNEPSPIDADGNPYVIYPTLDSLQDVAICYSPPNDGPLNNDDAQRSNIEIRDYDASNKAVPDVMAELLRYCGFVMVFFTDTASDGSPQTTLKVIRKDALSTQAPKPLLLAADGASSLDLASNNTTAIHLARDLNELVNQWTLETALKQVEVTVYLAPGFEPISGDDSSSNVTKWYSSNLTNATDISRRKYRWWIADECGDGHWNFQTSTWVTDTPLDLSPVFPNPTTTPNYTYCDRYRPGSRTLISKDPRASRSRPCSRYHE